MPSSMRAPFGVAGASFKALVAFARRSLGHQGRRLPARCVPPPLAGEAVVAVPASVGLAAHAVGSSRSWYGMAASRVALSLTPSHRGVSLARRGRLAEQRPMAEQHEETRRSVGHRDGGARHAGSASQAASWMVSAPRHLRRRRHARRPSPPSPPAARRMRARQQRRFMPVDARLGEPDLGGQFARDLGLRSLMRGAGRLCGSVRRSAVRRRRIRARAAPSLRPRPAPAPDRADRRRRVSEAPGQRLRLRARSRCAARRPA